MLSTCFRLGGHRSLLSSSINPRARSARCLVPSPVSVTLWFWSSVPLVAPWPSPLTWVSAVAGFTDGSTVGTPMLGICAVSVRRRALLWDQRRRRTQPAHHPLVAANGSARLGFSGGGGVSVPSLPPPVLPWHFFSLGWHPKGFVPPRELFHSGGVNALWRLDSSSHSLAIPPGVFRHSGGLLFILAVTT